MMRRRKLFTEQIGPNGPCPYCVISKVAVNWFNACTIPEDNIDLVFNDEGYPDDNMGDYPTLEVDGMLKLGDVSVVYSLEFMRSLRAITGRFEGEFE